MLSLYCELTLIASTLSKASRASQHGVQAVCFIHCGSIFWEIKEGERVSEWVPPPLLQQRTRCICFTPPLLSFSPSPASPLSGCTLKGINSVLKRISLVSCCQIRCAPLPFSVWGWSLCTAVTSQCRSFICPWSAFPLLSVYTSVISFTPTQLMVLWHSHLCFL